jgi:hypothetical protein
MLPINLPSRIVKIFEIILKTIMQQEIGLYSFIVFAAECLGISVTNVLFVRLLGYHLEGGVE